MLATVVRFHATEMGIVTMEKCTVYIYLIFTLMRITGSYIASFPGRLKIHMGHINSTKVVALVPGRFFSN